MSQFSNPLDHVKVAAPCNVDWDGMIGNERSRFCGQCSLNVYNLSDMTKREAEQLITSSEGRLCVRFYRRSDGSILTRNCPVGLRAIKRRMSSLVRAVTSLVLSFLTGLSIYEVLAGISAVELPQRHTMGQMAIPWVHPPTPPSLLPPPPMEMGRIAKRPKPDHLVKTSR
jgi:hypothetical protein